MKAKAQLGTSNPAQSTQSIGGVERNISENLGRLGKDVTLLTAGGVLSDEELEMFGKSTDVAKASRRDLAYLIVKELIGGKSLESNIELVKNNAVVGAKLAVSFYLQK